MSAPFEGVVEGDIVTVDGKRYRVKKMQHTNQNWEHGFPTTNMELELIKEIV